MKNAVLELKSTEEGIKSRLDKANYQISELEDNIKKKLPDRATKQKKTKKE